VPRVDSTVIRIEPIVPPPLTADEEHDLRELTRVRVLGWRASSCRRSRRLSLYLRVLAELAAEGSRRWRARSWRAVRRVGGAGAQGSVAVRHVRQARALGYACGAGGGAARILGLERRWRVALVGAGKIGAALLGYQDFRRQGFDIVAVFDTDPAKIGSGVERLCTMADGRELERCCGRHRHRDRGGAGGGGAGGGGPGGGGGVRAILNFAPTKLKVPAHVTVKTVNMALELEGLSYALVNDARARRVTARTAAAGVRHG
jgi:redox-sensing transcriptional repressor